MSPEKAEEERKNVELFTKKCRQYLGKKKEKSQ
jgi:hypothetical protein